MSWTTGQALRLRGEFLCPLPFFEPHLPDGVPNLLLHPDKAETAHEKYYQWYFLKGFFCHLIKGTSRVIQEDQPILHRDVQRLEDLCINHVGHRLPGHQNPINSLGTLPHAVCDKILMHLMKNKSLSPKAMQAFISW